MERKTETRSKHSVNHLLSFTETTLRHQFQASSSFATTSDFMTAVVRNFFYNKDPNLSRLRRNSRAHILKSQSCSLRDHITVFALFRLLAWERLVYL